MTDVSPLPDDAAAFLTECVGEGWTARALAGDASVRRYFQDRNQDGSWAPSSPDSFNGFAEGTSAQYTWMVPHNVAGLFQAMGGTDKARARLDAFFHNPDGSWAITGGDGTHAEMDNEPSIDVAWLYNYAGQPYKTQET